MRSTPATPRAPRASRATCSAARRTTRSARATCARGSARSPGWRRSGRRRCARWRELCAPLRAGGAPDAVEEYTIFQTLVGAWPIEPERLCAYMCKALREAKRNTSWVEPDGDWERRVLALLPRALRARRVPRRVRAVRRARRRGRGAARAAPDGAQADRARACPTSTRATSWWRSRSSTPTTAARSTGRAGASCSPRCATARAPEGPDARKLWLIRELLALRARRPEAFAGGYTPLAAGADAVAFLRGDEVAVALPIRGAAPRSSCRPGDWRPAFDPELLPGAGITVLERHS